MAKAQDAELKKARAALTEQAKLAEERSVWGKSLDAELNKTRAALVAQTKLVEERSARTKSLEAALHVAEANVAQFIKEHAEHAALAKAQAAELSTALRNAEELQFKLMECNTWALSLDAELHAACDRLDKTEQLLRQSLGRKTVLRRDIIAKRSEANTKAGLLLDLQLKAEVAETEIRRLNAALTDALAHVNHLLRQSELLQQFADGLDATRRATEEALRQQARELARYEGSLLWRLAARRPAKPVTPLQP